MTFEAKHVHAAPKIQSYVGVTDVIGNLTQKKLPTNYNTLNGGNTYFIGIAGTEDNHFKCIQLYLKDEISFKSMIVFELGEITRNM